MKGQVEKIETRSDNVVKISITLQPEDTPPDIINWRFQTVEVTKSDKELVTINASEYDALLHGDAWVMPNKTREAVKTALTVLQDLMEGE